MARTYRYPQRRPAFTLVEMLVAMALILFIMVILSEAFVAGLGSFRELKAIGDMEEKLRTATTILRRDLAADHFEGRRRMSDPTFWLTGSPREGFFLVYQHYPSVLEGFDSDGNPSYRAGGKEPPPVMGNADYGQTNHVLHFAVKLRGNNQDRFFGASVPNSSPLVPYLPGGALNPAFVPTNFFSQPFDGNFMDIPATGAPASTYSSPWGEVMYFLDTRNPTFAGTTPVYPLYRTQLAVAPDTRNINPKANGLQISDYLEMSCSQGAGVGGPGVIFHNPNDLAQKSRSLQHLDLTSTLPDNPMARQGNGTTLLLTDVISFDVRVLKYMWKQVPPVQDFDFSDLATATQAAEFDTCLGPGQPPMPPDFCISALQINIRVWDAKTEQARQVTIIQDM